MSDSIKETALAMALSATSDLMSPRGDAVVQVAERFEVYLAGPGADQLRVERDQARARVVALEQEIREIAAGLTSGVTKRALAAVIELSELYEATDKLVIGAAVESAAARLGVTL